MTNSELQAMIAELGDKIFLILMNNGRKVLLGVSGENLQRQKTLNQPLTIPVSTGDIVYKTVGESDFFGVPHVCRNWGKEVKYMVWWKTGFIEAILATDELGDDIPDLMGWV